MAVEALNIHTLWHKIVSHMKGISNNQNIDHWLTSIKPMSIENKTFYLRVSNQFALDWIKKHLLQSMESQLKTLTDVSYRISLVSDTAKQERIPLEFEENHVHNSEKRQNAASFQKSFLNPRYIFENFVVGRSNQFAHAASLAVAENPAEFYNPLFIYGGTGLGKTHIMQSIGNHILNKKYSSKIYYVSSENFMNEMIYAIQHGETLSFRNKYRGVDILLIDDIHFLGGKESTQEEFFHTFNSLYEAHRQIVLTSDRPPKDIMDLEERLISRFGWGLITDIQPPDLETRIAILKKKSEDDGITLSNDVILYLATNIKSNIRELEGCLIRLLAYSSILKSEITLDLAQKVLQDTLKREIQEATIESVQKVVCRHFKISLDELTGAKRVKKFAYPRQIAMYMCRTLLKKSYAEIGEKFGGKDHSTVIHAHDKIQSLLLHDYDLSATINKLSSHFK
jgi:chromosomal replication initiator protein